jgi:hypothetical protein
VSGHTWQLGARLGGYLQSGSAQLASHQARPLSRLPSRLGGGAGGHWSGVSRVEGAARGMGAHSYHGAVRNVGGSMVGANPRGRKALEDQL